MVRPNLKPSHQYNVIENCARGSIVLKLVIDRHEHHAASILVYVCFKPFGLDQRSCATSDPVSTNVGDRLRLGELSRHVASHPPNGPLLCGFSVPIKGLTKIYREHLANFCRPFVHPY